MKLFGPRSDPVAAAVQTARTLRRQQGHALSPLQEGIVAELAGHAADADGTKRLHAIRAALAEHGRWSESDEWRISTWFDSKIVMAEREGDPLYTASVACDGQRFACEGPSLERVVAFLHLYRAIIAQGFYAAGPPWAG